MTIFLFCLHSQMQHASCLLRFLFGILIGNGFNFLIRVLARQCLKYKHADQVELKHPAPAQQTKHAL